MEGEPVYLDPYDTNAAFGHLSPDLEGVRCLLLDKEEPTWVNSPQSSPHSSRRTAQIELTLDTDGRVAGHGSLELTGHHAWRRLNWEETADATRNAWREWLAERHPGFAIDELTVEESIDDRRVEVGWKMEQRAEEVLGNETSVTLSAPLGLDLNPFTLDPRKRVTPVHLPFRALQETRVVVSWPTTWEVDVEPSPRRLSNAAGAFATSVTIDPVSRSLTATRHLEVKKREIVRGLAYAELRDLYQTVVDYDAEVLILSRTP